jgi:hypothetical protein
MILVHFKGFIDTDQHRTISTNAQSDNKINESSQNLLNVLRRDSKTIQKNLETMKLS